jgi:hypothetical protein
MINMHFFSENAFSICRLSHAFVQSGKVCCFCKGMLRGGHHQKQQIEGKYQYDVQSRYTRCKLARRLPSSLVLMLHISYNYKDIDLVLHNPLGNRPRPFPALHRKSFRTPFIGRQSYLDLFVQMLREVRAGQPLALFLQGEAGMGKSRLLEAFQARVQRQGFMTASSRCRGQFSVPYWPFVAFLQPLGEHFATIGAPFQSHDLERLRAFLQGALPSPLRRDPPLPGQAEQDQLGLYLAISRALIGLARRQPTLVMIDDLHWADTLSLDLLSFLVFTLNEQASQAAVPLFLVVAHRPPQPGTPLEAFLNSLLREDISRASISMGCRGRNSWPSCKR